LSLRPKYVFIIGRRQIFGIVNGIWPVEISN